MTRNFPACVSRSWTIKRRGRGGGGRRRRKKQGRDASEFRIAKHFRSIRAETRYRLSADDRSFSRTGKSLSVMPGLFYIRKRCV